MGWKAGGFVLQSARVLPARLADRLSYRTFEVGCAGTVNPALLGGRGAELRAFQRVWSATAGVSATRGPHAGGAGRAGWPGTAEHSSLWSGARADRNALLCSVWLRRSRYRQASGCDSRKQPSLPPGVGSQPTIASRLVVSQTVVPIRFRLITCRLWLTSFIGREEEIREVGHLLAVKRLVTLTGTGGCGKTRLAQQVASEALATYPDGVWLVELAPLADPALVPQTIARALGLPERPDQPALTALTSFFQKRRALVVLDNCEHLIDACARVAASLLQECPQLTILATSRQPLQVLGEVQWHVPSLSTPDVTSQVGSTGNLADLVSGYPAIQLFVERAQAVQPALRSDPPEPSHGRSDLLAARRDAAGYRACGRAGPRLECRNHCRSPRPALPVSDDRKSRRLTATADASCDDRLELRSPRRQGADPLSAAGSVCWRLSPSNQRKGSVRETTSPSPTFCPALLRLVDQSLIEVASGEGTTRYRILETIREYAARASCDGGRDRGPAKEVLRLVRRLGEGDRDPGLGCRREGRDGSPRTRSR